MKDLIMDRKYRAKNSNYRPGTPVSREEEMLAKLQGIARRNIPGGPLAKPPLPKGRELPAMILPGEPGYEEDEIL